MKIIKYQKKGQNQYELTLEDNTKIKLYEDVILQENLLLTKKIDDLENIIKINSKYEIYEVSLKYLNIKVRSKKELKEYLIKKGYSIENIEENIRKLMEKGYLNDDYFAKCYIHDKVNLSMDGPLKIKKYLIDNEIDSIIIEKYLDESSDIWFDKINKYIDKQLKINKKSTYYFKNKMLINLTNLGYSREMINNSLNKVNVDNQDELRKKEEEKLRKKLSRKYTNEELERKIKEKLYQKGFF